MTISAEFLANDIKVLDTMFPVNYGKDLTLPKEIPTHNLKFLKKSMGIGRPGELWFEFTPSEHEGGTHLDVMIIQYPRYYHPYLGSQVTC